jgi:chaperonin GroES
MSETKTKLKIKPLGNNVVVEPIKDDKVTKSGIVIPETLSEETPQQGVIVSLGEGKLLKDGKRYAFSVKVGDRVIFKKYAPTEFETDDTKYLIIEEKDILGILD